AALEANELDMLTLLDNGNYSVSERMLLETAIVAEEGSVMTCHALNDIYASRINGRICDFAVSVDGHQIGVYRADGIIFSTPTGSSAYALSAGGPVIEPDLSLIEMNLICPHSLFTRPMLFSPQRQISVTCHGVGEEDGLRVNVDGTEVALLRNKQSFTVDVPAMTMPFANLKGHTFYDALNGKLMRPLKGM
ncbi:MAG: NAD(+)/NADH kinase, partial [Oscillospiraceae bacterium]|nr:NAD(+)/NADH kinase [Oscillospiraceae bacterium]